MKILGTLVLLAALGVGVALWVRHEAVNEQRATSAAEAASRATKATLTGEDACWLVMDFYHSGRGRVGRTPLVECAGELVAVPGGYKLTRVLTEPDFMSGKMVHDLCLGRGQGWTVLGEAYQLDDCRSLPLGSDDPAADAARNVRALVAEDVARARAAVKAALAQPAPPETCPSTAPAEGTAHLDARRLEPGTPIPAWTNMIPHDPAFELCVDPDAADPQAEFACKQRRPWTHVIVAQVQQIEPPQRHPGARESRAARPPASYGWSTSRRPARSANARSRRRCRSSCSKPRSRRPSWTPCGAPSTTRRPGSVPSATVRDRLVAPMPDRRPTRQ
ncbi:hypothetical protein [Nannocystis pusilla]|uniref:hypothetical protein n=1 Tax=Nannocystis pusilla TaxID=889268 RepID=UPI003B7A69FD